MTELHPIDRAIAAHAQWKSHLRQAIKDGVREYTVEMVRPGHRCDFGAWLLERSAAEKSTTHYQTVHALHAQFHQEAARVLELALSDQRENASAAMGIGSAFANLSSRLTATMTAWKLSLTEEATPTWRGA